MLIVLAIFAFASSGSGEGESSQDKIEARETVLAHGRYSPQSNFDLKSASLDATMRSARKGELIVPVEVNVSGGDERLKAHFEQALRTEAPDRP
jgi:hypothetical protein